MIVPPARIQKSDTWHKRRLRGIGGSEWNHIMSWQDPKAYKWGCLRRLYYEKKGIPKDFPGTTSRIMLRGQILESIGAELYQSLTGYPYSRKRPRAKYLFGNTPLPKTWIGNPDRVPETPHGLIILEIKTMGREKFFDMLENELPISHTLQVQHYLGKSGLDIGEIAVLWADGIDMAPPQVVPRDEELLKLMLDAGNWFMNDILTSDTPPDRPPLFPDRCAECEWGRTCLGNEFFELHDTGLVNLSDDAELHELLNDRAFAHMEEKEAKDRKANLTEQIEDYISKKYGDDVEHFFCREIEVKWQKGMSLNLDRKALEADHPDIVKKYLNPKPKRTFSPKVTKKSRARWDNMK